MTKPRTKSKKWKQEGPYLNREASWLQFNGRVLEEAKNPDNPLLERLKFLAIFESNLDEFYMVRVSGLIEQYESGVIELSPDGMLPTEQLDLIAGTAYPLRQEAGQVFDAQILPELEKAGVRLLRYEQLSEAHREQMNELFSQEIFPVCTPLILDPAPSVPFISNRSLNLAVVLNDETAGRRLARVKIPDTAKRLIRLDPKRHDYVLMEDVIRHNLQLLFPGVPIEGAYLFRVIRDADLDIRELEAGDLIESIEQTIRLRRFGDPVLLELEASAPSDVNATLVRVLNLDPSDCVSISGLLGMEVLWQLAGIDKPTLRFPAHHPFLSDRLANPDAIFSTVREGDVLIHHPYDSFRPIEEFVASAAKDPDVIGIKQTLYRVGTESPIVESLLAAAEAGKQVAVLVELKARFDESNNLVWARTLERAGVHVTYGFPELKTHCKLCLIVRREGNGIRSYAHIGTGNYNPTTARLYTDLGLFTANQDITQDVAELFNYLTGFSKQNIYRKLLVAPINLRPGILSRIRREIEAHKKSGKGRIIFKLNSLVDPAMIDALAEAAQAGVAVDLIIRGICCLRPQPNVNVVSVVGRFLEHSRVLYFANGGKPEVLIGSADLMGRNLDRRVEVLVPIRDQALVGYLRDELLENCFKDNTNSWALQPDGSYIRKSPTKGKPFTVQEMFQKRPATRVLLS